MSMQGMDLRMWLWLQVRITPLTTKRVEHNGIKVQLLGQIELASERGQYHDFVTLGESQCRSLNTTKSSGDSSSILTKYTYHKAAAAPVDLVKEI